MNPLVSILTPMYNAAEFIEETIDSVLTQTYSNIEIIIVDDGSTDDSYSIVSNLSNPNIKLVNNTGKGACSARNYAFDLSSGQYIQYLDADDLIHPNKIEMQINAINENKHVLAYGGWSRFYSDVNQEDLVRISNGKNYANPINLLVDLWTNESMVPIHSWLVPRELIQKAGKWNETLHHNQDGEFFSRVLVQASAVTFCENALAYYRSDVKNSISNASASEKNAASQLKSYQLYVKNLSNYKNNLETRKALASNFLNFIYRFHPNYPELLTIAEEEFHNLDVGEMWSVGGSKFKKISALIGFKNALKMRNKFGK